MLRARLLLVPAMALSTLASPACLASSMSPGESLAAAVDHYTDAVRWGRAASALEHVAPRLRRRVASRHFAWARQLRIAETSTMDVVHDDVHDRATVLVQVSWYRDTDPTVRTTIVEQRWLDRDGWLLVGETVVDGDEALFGFGAAPRRGEARRGGTRGTRGGDAFEDAARERTPRAWRESSGDAEGWQ